MCFYRSSLVHQFSSHHPVSPVAEERVQIMYPSCSQQHCIQYSPPNWPCYGLNGSMNATRQPRPLKALMHGSTLVQGEALNNSHEDSANAHHFNALGHQESHAPLFLGVTRERSHQAIHRHGHNQAFLPLRARCVSHSSSGRAKNQMPGGCPSQIARVQSSLEDSLLCSSWPPLPLFDPILQPVSASLPTPFLSAREGCGEDVGIMNTITGSPPLKPMNAESIASQGIFTPGLTPNTSISGSPQTDVPLRRGGFAHTPCCTLLEDFGSPGIEAPVRPMAASQNLAASPRGNFQAAGYLASNAVGKPFTVSAIQWDSSALHEFEEDAYLPARRPRSPFKEPSLHTLQDTAIIDPNPPNVYDRVFNLPSSEYNDGVLPVVYPDLSDNFDAFADLANGDLTLEILQEKQGDRLLPPIQIENEAAERHHLPPYISTRNAGLVSSESETCRRAATAIDSISPGEGSRRNTSRDAELMALRAKGLSYRDIKQYHGFDVAESTLRGRMRSLTKLKQDRVRKPTWNAENARLLCTCAMEAAIAQKLPCDTIGRKGFPLLRSEQAVNKVSWKKIAKAMADKGSYHYGNATVKKKYLELRREQLTRQSLIMSAESMQNSQR